jgi:hypothetical protein
LHLFILVKKSIILTTMSISSSLSGKSFASFKPLFATLSSPELHSLQGRYRGQFTGPVWLRFSAPSTLVLAGLGGWWGKTFPGDGTGYNLVLRQGRLQQLFPIRLAILPSLLDGKPCLAVQYTAECPFPWPHVIDELRCLDETSLLGLTIINLEFLRRLAFPFLLFPSDASTKHSG